MTNHISNNNSIVLRRFTCLTWYGVQMGYHMTATVFRYVIARHQHIAKIALSTFPLLTLSTAIFPMDEYG